MDRTGYEPGRLWTSTNGFITVLLLNIYILKISFWFYLQRFLDELEYFETQLHKPIRHQVSKDCSGDDQTPKPETFFFLSKNCNKNLLDEEAKSNHK